MADTQTLIDKTVETQPGITPEGWLTDSWYLGCTSKELKPGGLKHVIMLDQPIVIGRTEQGEAFALRDICPHRLVPLSAGKMIETTPDCPDPNGAYTFGTTVPAAGVAYVDCSLAGTDEHVPASLAGW